MPSDPLLVAATDTGHQIFTSNISSALLGAPLCPVASDGIGRGFMAGDVLEVHADVSQRRAWFCVGKDGTELTAQRLPGPSVIGASAVTPQTRSTPYYPFFAVRGTAKIQVLAGDKSSSLNSAAPTST